MSEIQLGTGVQSGRKEYRRMLRQWERIDDCLMGQDRIKERTVRYLPQPNAGDAVANVQNDTRYQAYLNRAIFYNVSLSTVSGMVGQIFAREPVSELPTRLDVLTQDAAGEGLTLMQLAKRACRYTLAFGRAGILADFPETDNGVSEAQIETGEVRPIVTVYEALNIINWREIIVRGRKVLTLVVLREEYDDNRSEFAIDTKYQYRVLRLRDGVYTVQVYRDGVPTSEEVIPTDSAGEVIRRIPFTFIGSENNDSDIDVPPMGAIANLNIGHYRNSADYEESTFVVGQPTLAVSGLTEDWLKNQLDGVINFGSRGGLALPANASAELLQMQPNSAAFEAMEKKERQMVALGAKLVEQRNVQRTAFETGVETASETSTLQDVANNVSAAIKFALTRAAEFTGDTSSEIIYDLNDEFDIALMSSQDREQVIRSWSEDNAITFSEMRAVLRKSGVATLPDDEARTQITAEMRERQQMAVNIQDDNDDDNNGNGSDAD